MRAGEGGLDRVAVVLEAAARDLLDHGVVVDDEDALAHGGRMRSSRNGARSQAPATGRGMLHGPGRRDRRRSARGLRIARAPCGTPQAPRPGGQSDDWDPAAYMARGIGSWARRGSLTDLAVRWPTGIRSVAEPHGRSTDKIAGHRHERSRPPGTAMGRQRVCEIRREGPHSGGGEHAARRAGPALDRWCAQPCRGRAGPAGQPPETAKRPPGSATASRPHP